MQTIAAYLIESGSLPSVDAHARASAVSSVVRDWLGKKGVKDPTEDSGTFESQTDNNHGAYSRKTTSSDKGSLEEIRLEELSKGGQTFITTLFITETDSHVSAHATLATRAAASVIAPIFTDPRCPSVIRSILGLYPDWMFGRTPIGNGKELQINGVVEADALVADLRSESRALPIVLVSQNEGEPVWPDLAKELARDLAGLAIVASIDDDTSWALTNNLGKSDSCYLGAVRLYWPARKLPNGDKQIPNTVWTASSLLSNDHDGKGMLRFRATMRRAVMAVASLTVEPPGNIREIQNAAARKQLADLEARADSNSEELELARLFIGENEQLKAELSQARSDIAKLSSRAEVAEYALAQVKAQEPSVPSAPSIEPDQSPQPDEVRFYKKMHSTPGHDVLVRVTDCGHTKWQNAAKADKARKGIEKLEGSSDWKSMQHCGSCQGGGMWKVRW